MLALTDRLCWVPTSGGACQRMAKPPGSSKVGWRPQLHPNINTNMIAEEAQQSFIHYGDVRSTL